VGGGWEILFNITDDEGGVGIPDKLVIGGTAQHVMGPDAGEGTGTSSQFTFSFNIDSSLFVDGKHHLQVDNLFSHNIHFDRYNIVDPAFPGLPHGALLEFDVDTLVSGKEITGYKLFLEGQHVTTPTQTLPQLPQIPVPSTLFLLLIGLISQLCGDWRRRKAERVS
jgi:hypothetical protein